jgi:hypothetical protein
MGIFRTVSLDEFSAKFRPLSVRSRVDVGRHRRKIYRFPVPGRSILLQSRSVKDSEEGQ